MPKLHLKQPGFTYNSCRPFTKHIEIIENSRETFTLSYIYKKELDKVCFAHDDDNHDKKDLAKNAVSDKILKDRAYEIANKS